MNKQHWAVRVLATVTVAAIAGCMVAYLVSEFHLQTYVDFHGRVDRNALSDDYGFAFANVFFSGMAMLVTFAVGAFLAWRALGKRGWGAPGREARQHLAHALYALLILVPAVLYALAI